MANHSVANDVHADTADRIADDLIELLRRGARAEDMAAAVRDRLELQQQRERGMLAVIESAQDLSSRLDLTSLLSAVVSRARNLLGADLAWLSTYDAARGEFRALVADGALSPKTSGMVTGRDRGVASVVMSTRLPFTTADYLHDKRFPHDAGLDDTFREEGIGALVGVPLIWECEVIGLLFVADRYHRQYMAQTISILGTLGTLAAVALKNARQFERANAAVAKAALDRAELERHVRNIERAAEAHEQMTSLLARGASLATLCQAIAQLLGGSMLVLDEAGEVVSRAGARACAAHEEHRAELSRALQLSRQSGRSVIAYRAGGESCRVMAVIGGDGVLGSILLFRREELDEMSVRTFERSSSVIGIVLLSQERMEATRSAGASSLLRLLLSPRQDAPALLADRAERHGLDLSQPLSLLLLKTDVPGAGHAARRLRGADLAPGALVDEIDGLLVVLCGAAHAADARKRVLHWARRQPGHRGVLSRPVSGPAAVPALYATLRRALTVLERIGVQNQVVGQNELALYSTLFETHDQASLSEFLEATIGPLIRHDRKRGSELALTLFRYFDCNQNAKTTARRLGIHVNTVRQRLTTIETLLGGWSDARRALEIHVALRLWSLGGREP
jgi:exonuclease VII small subunit